MNIVEAYIKKYFQLVILILGLPCTNKSEIAKELEIDLKLPIININDYLDTSKHEEIVYENDIRFKIYDSPKNYNWDKFNNDVNELKSSGVIIYGNYIDTKKIDFNYDFAFFYSMNTLLCKKILIEKKLIDFNKNNNLNNKNYIRNVNRKNINRENVNMENDIKEKIYFEKIFNPKYEEIKKNVKFNKFFNIKEETTFDISYDEVFDILMNLVKLKLKNY